MLKKPGAVVGLCRSAARDTSDYPLLEKEPCMLVLRRKVGESIIVDGVISVSILAVEGERVKIGISAPSDVSIVREELIERAAEPSSPFPPLVNLANQNR
jgi:carbon storage regulator